MVDLSLWPDVAPLLDQALDLEADALETFLGTIADEETRSELQRYLHYAATGKTTTLGDLLRQRPIVALAEGTRVGPYAVRHLLGSGGAGAVYEALDVRADKLVALKVVKGTETPDLPRHVEREVQLLSRLDHPNVVRYLGAGDTTVETADGTSTSILWIAMELVEGELVTAFAERERLTAAERVDLLIQACGAVQHALGRAVLHRDLKPSNVMATRDDSGHPTVKVVDFGVARLVEETEAGHTPQTSFRLTPAYAAPEQLLGQVTTSATDVWGLGKVGGELLGDDPGRDYLAILDKACSENPADRYDDAGALCLDLQRAAARRPVHARGTGLAYRTRLLVARRWRSMVAALLALGVVAFILSNAIRSELKARTESARASEIASLLEAAFDESSPTSGGDYALSREFVRRIEAAVSSADGPDLEVLSLLGAAYLSAGDLAHAIELQEDALAAAQARSGEVDPRVARVLGRLGVTLGRANQFARADSAFDAALQALAAAPDDDIELDVLTAHGEYLVDSGRLEEAKRVLRRAFALCRQSTPDDARCYRPVQGIARVLVIAEDSVGIAVDLNRRVLSAYRKEWGARDSRTAFALVNLALALHADGRTGDAIQQQRTAVDVLEATLGENHPTYARAAGVLGSFLIQSVRGVREPDPKVWDEATRLLKLNVDNLRRTRPNTIYLASALNYLTATERGGEGAWERRHALYREALDILDRIDADESLPLYQTLTSNLAVALMRLGRLDEAEPLFIRYRDITRRQYGDDHPRYAEFLLGYAQQLSAREDLSGAERALDRAIEIQREAHGADHPDFGTALITKGVLLVRWGARRRRA